MKSVSFRRLAFFFLLLVVVIIDLPKQIPLKTNVFGANIDTSFTRPEINLRLFGSRFYRDLEVKQGLDLQGGTEIILLADMAEISSSDRSRALESAEEIIRRRVDLFGVSEPLIQRSVVEDQYRLIVQLPGIKNVDQALQLIGQTAQMDFREQIEPIDEEATASALALDSFVPTGLTGKDLAKSQVQFGTHGTGGAQVSLEFTEEGKQKFADITKRNIGKPVAIFLDQFPLTIPIVQQEITDGNAVISGDFTTQQANQLAIQLNAGALPTPIEIIQQRTVGATLGADSVSKSLKAGLVGLAIVMLFMIAYYGWLGFIADVGLVIYGLITLSIYKLLPVTLTLPGLAGFILSVGMAVDSNILVFERMKEEIRIDKPWQLAMELGFGRAWDSIKDANIATLTTSFILFNPLNWSFLPQSGMVRGFALTLGLGVLISLFTGIVVTRSLLRTFYKGDTKPSTKKVKTK